MAGQRVTIALMMKFTALVALNLALLLPVADRAPESPVICFMFAALNLVIIQAVLLDRPLQTFHHLSWPSAPSPRLLSQRSLFPGQGRGRP